MLRFLASLGMPYAMSSRIATSSYGLTYAMSSRIRQQADEGSYPSILVLLEIIYETLHFKNK